MNTLTLHEKTSVDDLIRSAHETDKPVVVYREEDECLVLASPATFERILCEGEALKMSPRSTARL